MIFKKEDRKIPGSDRYCPIRKDTCDNARGNRLKNIESTANHSSIYVPFQQFMVYNSDSQFLHVI